MTILNKKDKYIFIHIPKTGGQTIKKSLDEDDLNCIKCNGMLQHIYDTKCSDKENRLRNPYHFIWEEIRFHLDITNPEKYFIFTFVRNPYDRFYSLYEHSKKEINSKTKLILSIQMVAIFLLITAFFFKKNKTKTYIYSILFLFALNVYLLLTFKYIMLFIDINTLSFNDFMKENFDSIYDIYYNYFKPQYHYTLGIKPNFIGREENFEDDIKMCLEKIGKKTEIKNKNINTLRKDNTSEFKYIDKFDIHTIDLVNKIYKKDFETFNYKKISIRDFVKINGRR